MNLSDKHQTNDKMIVTLDPDFEDLIPAYLQRRQADLEAIRQALAQNDFEKIHFLGHDMKGTGGGYGLDGLTEIGKVLEEAAKQENAGEIQRSVETLADYLARLVVRYAED